MASSTQGSMEIVCSECGRHFESEPLPTFCEACAAPLLVQYDLAALKKELTPESLPHRGDLWRWESLLPLQDARWQVSLGEGNTPLLHLPRLGEQLGIPYLYLKDEAQNPTGAFKARGISVALSKLLELGVRHFVLATAGNAGSALAVYAARANSLLDGKGDSCHAHVFMPVNAPRTNRIEVQTAGADLHLAEGLISDAGQQAAKMIKQKREEGESWFDLSTFKEPYRVEGKKTLGFELAEQFRWTLPDVIIYPTGGGTGLVGMWKAFAELEALGWIGSKRPRMISVQASGCAPLVSAFERRESRVQMWENAHTVAAGLCVPKPFADRLILRIVNESGGACLAVSDEEISEAQKKLAVLEGVFPCPEGAATLAALIHCRENQLIKAHEVVLLYNTASGLKYL